MLEWLSEMQSILEMLPSLPTFSTHSREFCVTMMRESVNLELIVDWLGDSSQKRQSSTKTSASLLGCNMASTEPSEKAALSSTDRFQNR